MADKPAQGRAVGNRFLAALEYGDFSNFMDGELLRGRGGVGADCRARVDSL